MHDLLLHTTGLSYGFAPVNDVVDQRYQIADLWASSDLDDFASRVARLPLKFQPGERWHYSIAVDITGLVVQRLSGQRFDRYLKEHIFEPRGTVRPLGDSAASMFMGFVSKSTFKNSLFFAWAAGWKKN